MQKHKRHMRWISAILSLQILASAVLLTGCTEEEGGMTLKKPTDLKVPEYTTAIAEGYDLAADGGLIYNPISREAEKTGKLNLYDGKTTRKMTMNGDGFTAVFTMPTTLVPYSAVPIDYTITKTGNVEFPLSIVATSFEEKGRGNNVDQMYDLSVPGEVAISIEYLGSVTGTLRDGDRHVMKPDNTDNPADAYPNYNLTELNPSGTVLAGDATWLKFRYTNTGNTILDAEGTGGFVIEPILQRKNVDGSYSNLGGLTNQFYRELTYVYPGESREFWLCFDLGIFDEITPEGLGLPEGNYRIEFKTYYRTEYGYEPYVTMWAGREMQYATYEFDVSATASNKRANPVVVHSKPAATSQNQRSWLHYFEEFMTTYEQYGTDPGKDVLSGRLWIQPASFTEQVVLKVITGKSGKTQILRGAFPVSMDTAAVKLNYNPNNINVVVNDEGIAYPVVYAQMMTAMRANLATTPYIAESIVEDLLDMQDAGVNVVTNQGWYYLYDTVTSAAEVNLIPGTVERRSNHKGDALKFSIDVIRRLGMKLDGMGTFYFGSAQLPNIVRWATGENLRYSMAYRNEADKADEDAAKAVGTLWAYQIDRWGDVYWKDGCGITQYFTEDTRGYTRLEMVGRMAMGKKEKELFRQWLTEKYGTIQELNKAWGTSYRSFDKIDPEAGLVNMNVIGFMSMYDYNNKATGFDEWSQGVIDLDIFRTELRVKNYADAIGVVREKDPKAMVNLRTEGSNMVVPGLDPATTNAHYRNIIYNALRNGSIPELVAMSDAIRSYTDYVVLPLTPSEVSEVTKLSVDNGLIPMLLPQFNNMRDYVINEKYGDNFQDMYNLAQPQKAALVKSLVAVFPWWQATYEAGGVPGILWQDLGCDGVVTETQQKEMEFFNQKIQEMMANPAVREQAKMDKPANNVTGLYSYDPEFVDSVIAEVRKNRK